MKLIGIIPFLLTLTVGQFAHAETFTCVFTEPWVTLTYSTSSKILVSSNSSLAPEEKYALKRVSVRESQPGIILWFKANGEQIARLELTRHGTDGMSETIYPYDIKTTIVKYSSGIGGCYTSLLGPKIAQ